MQRITVKQFDALMEKGRVFHSSLFLMRTTTGMPDTRVSAVAPQKVAKTAVVRNRTRRRIYEAVRAVEVSIKQGVYAAIFAKSGAIDASHDEISKDIENLFVKAGLLR